ncbi:hypothetical protein [uncultured Roseibium sp.]|uniref:N-acyl amino acid synthase FeeM domain-containing protein n=1 Tax=uncultured Roseibium sp. TaxID=1936171 RepID=UPI003217D874
MGADQTLLDKLAPYCGKRFFGNGDTLRLKGQHYRDMFVILEGTAWVELGGSYNGPGPIPVGAGSPVGEICFVQGLPATATVTAGSDLFALSLDDACLKRLTTERPDLVADLLRELAQTANERLSFNLSVTGGGAGLEGAAGINIILCRSEEQLRKARRLRYQVYCEELGRTSPHADRDNREISDGLDQTGFCFIAQKGGETIGTLRVNYACDGPLGGLETIYGMTASPQFPNHCGICTKFVVDKANRGGPTAMMLIAQAVQLGVRDGMHECYIDCIPSLTDYYRALGFEETAPEFLHSENGLSIPMKLNLQKHGAQMSGRNGLRHMLRLFLKSRAGKGETDQ